MSDCNTCVNGITDLTPCKTCLKYDDKGKFKQAVNYIPGNRAAARKAAEDSGQIPRWLIGEYEYNVKRSMEQIYKNLFHVCEQCGGMVERVRAPNGNEAIILYPAYEQPFIIVYIKKERVKYHAAIPVKIVMDAERLREYTAQHLRREEPAP